MEQQHMLTLQWNFRDHCLPEGGASMELSYADDEMCHVLRADLRAEAKSAEQSHYQQQQ